MPAVAGSQRSCRMSSLPPITGIIMSVTTRSGGDSRTARSAGRTVPGVGHLMPGPLEDPPEQEPLGRLVIHHQNPRHQNGRPSTINYATRMIIHSQLLFR